MFLLILENKGYFFSFQAEKCLTACGTSKTGLRKLCSFFSFTVGFYVREMAKMTKPRYPDDRIVLYGQIQLLTIPNNPDLQCKISEGYMQNSSKYKIPEAISEARQKIKGFFFILSLSCISFTVSSSFGMYILYAMNRNAVL